MRSGRPVSSCSSSGSSAPWLGALVGTAIDPSDFGLDAAAPAVFLALLWPGLRKRVNRWVALAGAAVALVLVPVAPAGVPVIAAAGVALVAGLLPVRPDPAAIAVSETQAEAVSE